MLPYSPDQRPVNQWGKSIAKTLVNFSCCFHAFSILFAGATPQLHFHSCTAKDSWASHGWTFFYVRTRRSSTRNEPLGKKKDPKRNNQDPSEERVEMKRFTWRIHASRRKKMMCIFHNYSILFSIGDKIYWWWRPQIVWMKLVFPCIFLCFWMEEINLWEVNTACFPQFFHTVSEFSQFYSTFLSL